MNPAVEFKNVTKRFGDVIAVDDFSLSVQKGQFVTLLGSSGSSVPSLSTICCVDGSTRETVPIIH